MATDVSQTALRIQGMTCAGCASNVQKALERVQGVTTASVSFVHATASIEGERLDTALLVDAVRSRGYDATTISPGTDEHEATTEHADDRQSAARLWRRRAIIGTLIWVPMAITHLLGAALDWHGVGLSIGHFIGATLVIATAGYGFLSSAWRALRHRSTNMDTLISLGAGTAYVYSTVLLAGTLLGVEHGQPLYFSETVALFALISIGHWLEARATATADADVRALLELQPDVVERRTSGNDVKEVPVREIEAGDVIRLRPGARVAVDGVIIDGSTDVDESAMTGEPNAVSKAVDDEVLAGTMNLTGQVDVRATSSGRETTLTRIADLVMAAQASRAPIQRLADKVSSIFVPAVLGVALLSLIGWSVVGDVPTGVIAAVTVLIISCPCALGLATPMAVMVGTGEASRRGILIKDAATIERLAATKRVIFDKTGTLTIGAPTVTGVEPVDVDEGELLRLAASVEQASEHPIAGAIVAYASERGIDMASVEEFRATAGTGVEGMVGGSHILIERDDVAHCRVVRDGTVIGRIHLDDAIREDATDAIEALSSLDITTSMLTGDQRERAKDVARAIGMPASNVYAEQRPDDKHTFIEEAVGRSTPDDALMMVGDGINDAAALARAEIGVSFASGTDIAMDASDVVVLSPALRAVPEMIRLARRTLRTIRQNLFFAFAYNVCAIPLAAFGLLGEHGPVVAAAAMAGSDLTVIGNALRLRVSLRATRRTTRSTSP